MNDFFKDLKVIELSSVLAGPSVGMFFAELGAQVIKIENTAGGDMTRHWKLESEDNASPISAYFSSVNFAKEHLFLDYNEKTDLKDLHSLIADADIVIGNFKVGSGEKFGLDAPSLMQTHPSLIYGQITGFESDTAKSAFDVVLQAECGFISMTGSNEDQLCKMPVALIDVIAAHQLKEGILMALLKKERIGKGSLVTASLERSALSSLVNQASNYLMTGAIAKPLGTLHPNISPYGDLVKSADGQQFVLAVGTEKHFVALCDILSIKDLAVDERFSANKNRVVHRVELIALIQDVLDDWTADRIEKEFNTHGIPIGRIKSVDEVLSSSFAQKMILEEEVENRTTKRLSSIAFKLS